MNSKKLSIVNCQLSIFLITVFFTLPLKAQVNIGSDTLPHSFSILELTTSSKNGGLRLPQLNNAERDTVEAKFNINTETAEAAKGLVIYNIETGCLEFWNGKEWISLCSEILPAPTVVPQTNPTLTTNGNIRITAYVNAMYDFQHQKLTAYLTSGDATAYQWQISTDGGATWYDISGATKADFLVPADFMYSLGNLGLDKNNTNISSPDNNSLEIQFRCQITNGSATDNTAPENILSMLFIRTNTSGYGIDATTGVRYLTIQRGDIYGLYGGKIKIALLNLGASGTGSLNQNPLFDDSRNLNDAGDLGDFYQWGRVADGHQHTVWRKGIDRNDSITPMTGNGATSDTVTHNTSLQVYNLNGQIDPSNTEFYGNFICSSTSVDWGTNAADNYDLWGNTYNTRFTGNNGASNSPISLNGAPPTWTSKAQSNNPCPNGWRVPSRFEFSDIYNDNGSGTLGSMDEYGTVLSGNIWSWRDATNNAIGGVFIANSFGEEVFLPATGSRGTRDGALYNTGSDGIGLYWSSTYYNEALAYGLYLDYSEVSAGYNQYSRINGFSVRCVAE